MSLNERVAHSSDLNAQLLHKLGETEAGHLSLPQSRDETSKLHQEVNATASTLERLQMKTKKELKDLQDQRDSSVRKRIYKMSGQKDKFEARTEKEKAEYLEALDKEKQANEKLESLRANLASAQTALAEHENASKQFVSMQGRLDQLYDSIFAGPTPEFPDEDNLEERLRLARAECEECRTSYESEAEVLRLLDQSGSALRRAISEMGSARDASTMDTFGGGAMVSMMKRDAMNRAQSSALQAQGLMRQAQDRSKHVQSFPSLQFAQGGATMDVFFDNIFTDLAVRDQIIQSQDKLMHAARILSQQIRLAHQRKEELHQKLYDATEKMEVGRRNLQRRREQIFEQLTSAPPAYAQPEAEYHSQG